MVGYQRGYSTPIHALCGQMLPRDHWPPSVRAWPAYRWIRARSYYHWKVAELDQLKHCPHLQGLPVPLGPMEHPSELQQPQRPNKPGATAPGTSGRSRVGGRMT